MTKIRKPMRRRSMQGFKGAASKKTRKQTAVGLSESGQSKKFKDREVAKSGKTKRGYRDRMDAAAL